MPKPSTLITAAVVAGLAAAPAHAATKWHLGPPDWPGAARVMADAKRPSPASCLRGAADFRQERVLRRAIRVLRARRGMVWVRGNARLTLAARHHSHRLVRRGLFEHSARLPYGRARAGGQNLARAKSARQALRLMMGSPPHRRTLLDRRWRSIGIGATRDCRGMITFTVNLAAGPPR